MVWFHFAIYGMGHGTGSLWVDERYLSPRLGYKANNLSDHEYCRLSV